jgi:outer membrane protein OmpA-like peptidoglycan-associated protein
MLMLKGKIMKKNQMITLALVAAMLPLSACVTDPTTGKRTISKAAIGGIGGALGGYLLGDLIGGKRDRTEKIVGAGIGALAGAGAGYYMDEQEKKLRLQTAGSGVNVIRDGDNLVLDMPSEVTFGVDSANIDAGFRNTLDQVASTLTQYEKTYVDVMGHTDSTGSDAYNQTLSERRASAVADYLLIRGVQSARLATRGYGESQPKASNLDAAGRSANRRVEIRLVPVTQG